MRRSSAGDPIGPVRPASKRLAPGGAFFYTMGPRAVPTERPTRVRPRGLRGALALSLLACALGSAPGGTAGDAVDREGSRLVYLLEYVGTDYGDAVRDGAVVNQAEYGEVLRFTKELARDYGARRDRAKAVLDGIAELQKLIVARAPADEVFAKSRALLPALAKSVGGGALPSAAPRLADGRRLYERDCAPCHGDSGAGDGPQAAGMDPPPTALRGAYMERLSPRQVYNALTFGDPGHGDAVVRRRLRRAPALGRRVLHHDPARRLRAAAAGRRRRDRARGSRRVVERAAARTPAREESGRRAGGGGLAARRGRHAGEPRPRHRADAGGPRAVTRPHTQRRQRRDDRGGDAAAGRVQQRRGARVPARRRRHRLRARRRLLAGADAARPRSAVDRRGRGRAALPRLPAAALRQRLPGRRRGLRAVARPPAARRAGRAGGADRRRARRPHAPRREHRRQRARARPRRAAARRARGRRRRGRVRARRGRARRRRASRRRPLADRARRPARCRAEPRRGHRRRTARTAVLPAGDLGDPPAELAGDRRARARRPGGRHPGPRGRAERRRAALGRRPGSRRVRATCCRSTSC